MTIIDALQMYKIPYMITDTKDVNGSTVYTLIPCGAGATITKLKSRLNDIQIATGRRITLEQTETGLYIKDETDLYKYNKLPVYDWYQYNGYIDFDDPAIPFIVGFNEKGVITDTIAHCPHMLIAGTTGSGKSVFLHSLIWSIICNKNKPSLILVDCKQVEFCHYEKWCKNISYQATGSPTSAAAYTARLIEIMETRLSNMRRSGFNDFSDYSRYNPDEVRIIIIIDELSDLLESKESKKIIVPRLLRLAQKGRAAGIHVILATQRPDATVINGTLKGNLPTRLAFHTITKIDSRIILDQSGAELLRGNGDGLYIRNGQLTPERIQAPYISLDQIKSA